MMLRGLASGTVDSPVGYGVSNIYGAADIDGLDAIDDADGKALTFCKVTLNATSDL